MSSVCSLHTMEIGPHPVVASAARELLNKSENERSGVLSTAMRFLGLYRDPVVANVTSRCEWRIADIVEGQRPTTLYLVVPPSDISRTKPLRRIQSSQGVQELTGSACHSRESVPFLFETSGKTWLANPTLGEEIFGPLGIVVRVKDRNEMFEIARNLHGQLTCTLHMDVADNGLARELLPILERKAGRLLANGFPTGVVKAQSSPKVRQSPYPTPKHI